MIVVELVDCGSSFCTNVLSENDSIDIFTYAHYHRNYPYR